MDERKEMMAELIAYAQEGELESFMFLLGKYGKAMAYNLGLPHWFVWSLVMEDE